MMIAPTTVQELANMLDLPSSEMPMLQTWWDQIARFEREECAKIALAIDSGRGNEAEIARAIRERR